MTAIFSPSSMWLRLPVLSMALLLSLGRQAVAAQKTDCDRNCLRGIADQVLKSMTDHDPSKLAVTVPYVATENGKASILPMMSLWRTPTSISDKRQYALDPDSGQIFVAGVLQEGGSPSIFATRIKVEGRKIAEFEGYIIRSKSDTGLHFNPSGVENLPELWTKAIPAAERATREELQRAGRAAWDASVTVPVGKGCQNIENGDNIGAEGVTCPKVANPTDTKARVVVVDVEQGIAVAIGHMQGIVVQGGAFIPGSMMEQIRKMPEPPEGDEFKKIMREQGAADTVILVNKFYAKQLQGTLALMYIQGPGAVPIWTQSSSSATK